MKEIRKTWKVTWRGMFGLEEAQTYYDLEEAKKWAKIKAQYEKDVKLVEVVETEIEF